MAINYETTVTPLANQDYNPISNGGDTTAPSPTQPAGNGWKLISTSIGNHVIYYTWQQGSTTVTVTTNYNVQVGDEVILADATSEGFSVILPATPIDGQTITIKKIDSSANTITIDGNGNTIDGNATDSISTQYQSLTVASDGNNWFII